MLSSGVDRELVANQIGDDVQTMSKYYAKYISQPDHEDLIRNALNRISQKSVLKSDFEGYIRERSVPFFIFKLLFYID